MKDEESRYGIRPAAAAVFAAVFFTATGSMHVTAVENRTVSCGNHPEAGWRVTRNRQGVPCLYRDGKPVPPVLFWQWELEKRDVLSMSSAGIDIFSCFGSFPHYMNPFWVRGGFGGMRYQDVRLDRLFEWNPKAYVLPRLFYSAPNWWIAENPEENIRYSNPLVRPVPDLITNQFAVLARESFASEKFIRESSAVYRKAVRHLMDRYGSRLMGIHLTSGPWGEHFSWDVHTQTTLPPVERTACSDVSAPMTRRFRRYLRTKYGDDVARLRKAWCDTGVTFENAVVPPVERRIRLDVDGVWRDPARGRQVPDYFECMNLVTVEMLENFARIVKDESGGRLPTLAFYGYTQDEHWAVECDHRAISAAYRSPYLDMFSAPHTYHRRSPGEDASPRCYMASAALHGKLFIDEGDDMTHLEQSKPHPDPRCSVTNMFESRNILYREFGMSVTHGTGLWYMDLTRGTFRAPELVDAVARMRKAAETALHHDRTHVSEVAVVSNVESEFYMGYRRTEANKMSLLLYHQQMGAFYRAGAPFDWYLAEDLDAVAGRKYKVVVFLDCQYLTGKQKSAVDAMKSDGRTLVFFHAPGYVSETGLSRERMEDTCGVKMKKETVRGVLSAVEAGTGREWGCGLDRVIDGLEDRPRGVRHRVPGTAQRGLFLPAEGDVLMTGVGNLKGVPVAVERRRPDWTAVFSALPALSPDVLRRLYVNAGVHVYTDSDVVLSANGSWIMLHTRASGHYIVRLPEKAMRVTDVTTDKVVSENTDILTLPLEKFQTSILLVERENFRGGAVDSNVGFTNQTKRSQK